MAVLEEIWNGSDPIDSPHTVDSVCLVWPVAPRKHNMKMANSPETGLLSAGAAVWILMLNSVSVLKSFCEAYVMLAWSMLGW